jgi:hypothetical protein
VDGCELTFGLEILTCVGDCGAVDTVSEKVRQRRADVVWFDQKRIVAVVGFDDVVCDLHVGRTHRLGE